MENRAYAAVAAAFLIIFTAGSAYLFYWLQSGEPGALPFRLVSTHEVNGLQAEADVTYMGLIVGHVSRVRLDPDNPDRVLVDIRVRRGVPVVRSMHAELETRGVTGVAHVKLVKPAGRGPGSPLETSARSPAVLRLEPGGLATLMSDAGSIADRLKRLSQQLTALTSEDNRRTLMDTVAAIQNAATRVQHLEARLEPTLETLPAVAEDARAALQQSQALLARADDAAGAVDQAGQAGARLAQSARRDTLPQINSTLDRLQATARQLQQLAERLERQPQSVLLGSQPSPPGPGEPGFEPPESGSGDEP